MGRGLRPQPCRACSLGGRGGGRLLRARPHPDPHICIAGGPAPGCFISIQRTPVCSRTPRWRHIQGTPVSLTPTLVFPPGLHPLPRAGCLRSPSWTRTRAEQNREKQPVSDAERQPGIVDTCLTVERPKED